MSKIAQYYVEENNPDGANFPGVPQRDLTQEEFDELPEWLQRSVDASKLYRKSKPRPDSPTPREESED